MRDHANITLFNQQFYECVVNWLQNITKVLWLGYILFHILTIYGFRFDYVRIHSGSSLAAPVIGTYCGSRSPFSVVSTASSLAMMFKSDSSFAYQGFNASYEIVGE